MYTTERLSVYMHIGHVYILRTYDYMHTGCMYTYLLGVCVLLCVCVHMDVGSGCMYVFILSVCRLTRCKCGWYCLRVHT